MKRKGIFLKFYLIVILQFFATFLFSANWYVATNGNNSANGSITNPWATIRYGAVTMNGGDILNIRKGIYPGDEFDIEEIKSGTSTNKPTIIQSYPGEYAVYFPNNSNLDQSYHGILLAAKSNIILNGFAVNANHCRSDGIKLTSGTKNVIITNMLVYGCPHGMGILTTGVDGQEGFLMNSIITHSKIITNGWNCDEFDPPLHQLYLQTSGMTVEDCYIQGVTNNGGGTSGIHYFGTHCTNGIFRNNFVTNCANGVWATASYGSNCWIYNNVIVGGYSYGIAVNRMQYVYVWNNTCYSNASGIDIAGSTNVWVENNITTGGSAGAGAGIYLEGKYNNNDYIWARNNLSYSNLFNDFSIYKTYHLITNDNLFFIIRYADSETKTTNSINYNAKFINPITNNFKVLIGSDAIGNGVAQTYFSTDINGIPRTSSKWTIGANQYQLQSPKNLQKK